MSEHVSFCRICEPTCGMIATVEDGRLVKIRPDRPRAAWLWLVCSASVDFPESIVPVKNCSSAMGLLRPPAPGRASRRTSASRASR